MLWKYFIGTCMFFFKWKLWTNNMYSKSNAKAHTVPPEERVEGQQSHACLDDNQYTPFFSLWTPPSFLCNVLGNTCLSLWLGSSCDRHPRPHSAVDPLTLLRNVYPNCSRWQQAHDGALKEKVQPVWVRRKMRREGGVCSPKSQTTLV